MLTLTELQPGVHELTLEGVIERADIETARRELTPLLEGAGRIGLVVRAEGMTDITADAIIEDLRYEFSMLPKWAQIARMAVVSDKQAFAALVRWIDPVLPMIEMRAFPASQVEAARAFAANLDDAPAPEGPGVRMLADGSDGVIAWEFDGRVSREDVARVFGPLEKATEGGRKVNLLVRFKSYEGFDLSLLTDGDFLGRKVDAVRHIARYAVVGAPPWMGGMLGMVAPMMPFEIRQFTLDEEAEARQWVGMA